jgi:hypothetical protein
VFCFITLSSKKLCRSLFSFMCLCIECTEMSSKVMNGGAPSLHPHTGNGPIFGTSISQIVGNVCLQTSTALHPVCEPLPWRLND